MNCINHIIYIKLGIYNDILLDVGSIIKKKILY